MDSFVPKYIFHYEDFNRFADHYNSEDFEQPFVAAVENEDTHTFVPRFNKWNANGHEYVDMGFESGTLWATCNIGANSPTETGLRLRWGETEPLTGASGVYQPQGYKWYDYDKNPNYGNATAFTKYNATDHLMYLDPQDDAAHVYMGGDWRMPTVEEASELLSCTTTSYSTLTSTRGYLTLTSKINGNKVVFPTTLYKSCHEGRIWTNTLYHTDFCTTAQAYGPEEFSGSQYCDVDRSERCYTWFVRGVINKYQNNEYLTK